MNKELENKMNAEFKTEAEKVGASKIKLKRRLLAARSVLLREYRQLFDKYTLDFDNKRMYCADKSYALQWHNSGATTQGSVYLRELGAKSGE